MDEDLAEMDTSHFDQQSFLIDGPDSDQGTDDETEAHVI